METMGISDVFPYHGQWLVRPNMFIIICNSAHNPYQHLCFIMIHVPRTFHTLIQLYYVISYMFPFPVDTVGRLSRQSSQEWTLASQWCYGSRCCIWKGSLPSRELPYPFAKALQSRWFSFSQGPIDLQAFCSYLNRDLLNRYPRNSMGTVYLLACTPETIPIYTLSKKH